MRRIGVGYRTALHEWLISRPAAVGCLEITAEHFFDGRERLLTSLRSAYPLIVHGLGLSLGTPGPLDASHLRQFARVAKRADAGWVSEHVAFSRTPEVDLGHLNPVPLTRASLAVMVDHALEVSEKCGRRLLLENITSDVRIGGELSETDFLGRLCEASGCGLLLDVTNLFINSRNHRYDPLAWLREIDARHIEQLHVVGYTRRGDQYHDYHGEAIQPDLLELVQQVLEYAAPRAIILERDARLDRQPEIHADLCRLTELAAAHGTDFGPR